MMEIASLVTLVINTLLTGVLGFAALRLRASLEDIGEELEELNDDEDDSETNHG